MGYNLFFLILICFQVFDVEHSSPQEILKEIENIRTAENIAEVSQMHQKEEQPTNQKLPELEQPQDPVVDEDETKEMELRARKQLKAQKIADTFTDGLILTLNSLIAFLIEHQVGEQKQYFYARSKAELPA